jgi:sugar phosphate isomerase/epimerase
MKQLGSRRDWIKTSAALAGCASLMSGINLARAVTPTDYKGSARLRLSLAAYSFRDYFKDLDHTRDKETDAARRIDMFDFIDYCAAQGCEGAELTSYYFPKDLTESYLLRIKRHAFVRGVSISGTAVGNTFTHTDPTRRGKEIAHVKSWVDRAAILGAPHIRVFAGGAQSGQSLDTAKKVCIEALEECGEYAATKGIFLGIENHGGIVADATAMIQIVQAVKSPWVGINLDTGNFHTDDVYGDIASCAPYAVNVQIKADIHAKSQPKQAADLGRLVKILREAKYRGFVALEYESKPDPYEAIPKLLSELRTLFAA